MASALRDVKEPSKGPNNYSMGRVVVCKNRTLLINFGEHRKFNIRPSAHPWHFSQLVTLWAVQASCIPQWIVNLHRRIRLGRSFRAGYTKRSKENTRKSWPKVILKATTLVTLFRPHGYLDQLFLQLIFIRCTLTRVLIPLFIDNFALEWGWETWMLVAWMKVVPKLAIWSALYISRCP